ncbi:MAG: serine hydrolase [Flavobacteriales bacterium]|nr:serine hydrolase [Flavobacteriales bacterium]
MKRRHLILPALAAVFLAFGNGPERGRQGPLRPAFMDRPSPWADSVFASLTLDERIAQLMMVAAYSNKGAKHEQETAKLIAERNIGGLIFFQGGPRRQAELTNRYQNVAKTPLLLGMDLEWGLAMRLDSTVKFPRQMTLGALRNDEDIVAMGREIARQMRRMGVHVSFSPVADVNNNPANPVINDRSFGEDRELVARKSIAYMKGLQQGGVIATAKHFPGHGDTDTDSHLALPVIAHSRTRLDSLELYPFHRLVEEGLQAVMVAHLEVPAIDSTPRMPSTLSKPVVSDLLSRELGFTGLIFTDALNMKGVSKADKPGEIELRALLAGNDVMLFPQDPVKAIERIRQAVDSGVVAREMIDHRCLKVLRAKEWAGLAERRNVALKDLDSDLNTAEAQALKRALYARSLTLLRNRDGFLPILRVDSLRIAAVAIGDEAGNAFHQGLARYAPVTTFTLSKTPRKDSLALLLDKLKGFDLVIASVHKPGTRPEKDFNVPDAVFDALKQLNAKQRTAVVYFGNPYRLTRAYGAQDLRALLLAYEENAETMDLAAQALFGAIGTPGRMPVTPSSYFQIGDGLEMAAVDRFRFGTPASAGIDPADMLAIDAVVKEGLTAKAYPGCQVLVAVDGQVVWNKAYGHTNYAKDRTVTPTDLYDLASITKVAASTLALMKLVDQGKLDLNKDLGTYLPELERAHPAHARMGLRDILTHQAGLKPFMPFWTRIRKDGQFRPGVVTTKPDSTHGLRVADNVFLLNTYTDSLYKWVLDTPLSKQGEYVYSDMGYYLLMRVVERLSGRPLDRFVDEEFYAPLGLATMGYQPLKRFPKERIMPTEYDVIFRNAQVWGDVHDPGAAMLGGVAGHAGLFSNALDVAVLMQLLVNGGTYGGRRFLTEEVVKEFTKCQFCKPDGRGNRRALGFDKPARAGEKGPTCECVSYASYGHTGFTGTMAWADPETRTVYVFLSNRVYPSADNKKLQEMNIRTKVQEAVSQAVARRTVSQWTLTATSP